MGNKIKWMNIKKAIKLKADMQARGPLKTNRHCSRHIAAEQADFLVTVMVVGKDREGESWEYSISRDTAVPK